MRIAINILCSLKPLFSKPVIISLFGVFLIACQPVAMQRTFQNPIIPIETPITPEPVWTPVHTVENSPGTGDEALSKPLETSAANVITPEPASDERDVSEGVDVTPEIPPELPEEFYIKNITGHRQHYPLGCEASAAIDWANYFGSAINEVEFQTRLPVSDNPDYGFVGIVTGPWGQVPPYAYGVHAGPVAALLREYGLNAKGEKNFSIEQIKAEIANGQPVIAWVIGNCVGGIPYSYVDSQGREVTVAAYEHVVIVTGYSNLHNTLRYMNNGKFYDIPVEYFERSWAVLEKMVVYISD